MHFGLFSFLDDGGSGHIAADFAANQQSPDCLESSVDWVYAMLVWVSRKVPLLILHLSLSTQRLFVLMIGLRFWAVPFSASSVSEFLRLVLFCSIT